MQAWLGLALIDFCEEINNKASSDGPVSCAQLWRPPETSRAVVLRAPCLAVATE